MHRNSETKRASYISRCNAANWQCLVSQFCERKCGSQ